MTFGTVASVEAQMVGSELIAASAIAATTLTVDNVTDFDEEGGLLLLNDVILAYTGIDADTDIITLASGLAVAAAVDDPVAVVEGGKASVEWVANVVTDEGDTIPAVIPTALVRYFEEGTYDETVTVRLVQVGSGYEVAGQPLRDAVFDGAGVWNPHLLRYMTALSVPNATWTRVVNMNTRSFDGIDVNVPSAGYNTVINPGVYWASAQAAFAGNVTGRRGVAITVDGSQVTAMSVATEPAGGTFVSTGVLLALDELQVVSVEVYQNSGAALALAVTPDTNTNFNLYRVSI